MQQRKEWIAAFDLNGILFPAYGQESSSQILLSPTAFDPLQHVPAVAPSLSSEPTAQLFIVQFNTQPTQQIRQEITTLGGTVYGFVPNHSHVVKMDQTTRGQVEALAYVRWVGPYHPAYRLEAFLRESIDQGETLFPLGVYNIAVFESGLGQKNVVAPRIAQIGGTVTVIPDNGYLLFARLTPQQLLSVAHWDEVAFVDRWFPPQLAMNVARDKGISGANYVETVAGYRGDGVRGEVMDTYLRTNHVAFQPNATRGLPILHGPQSNFMLSEEHGTKVFGCAFGDGTQSGIAGAKGIIPHAQGIFADFCRLEETVAPESTTPCDNENIADADRYEHTAELVDPNGVLTAVFQSNSWGSGWGASYASMSQLMDDILFQHDLLACQAQGNDGSTTSFSEAWAKNAVSVGGVHHYDTLDKGDDSWFREHHGAGSIGPASDGRIKPDFVHFFDSVYTTYYPAQYTDFGGTSAATPITCGYFGLFFQMWADGVFGNTLPYPGCNPAVENCVFKNRPHMTTAKAMMINTATPYTLPAVPPQDFTRTNQGWGLVQVGRLHILRSRFPLIINETHAFTESNDPVTYNVTVPANTRALRATMVYADPPGSPAVQSQHAVHNLTLKVTAPNGTTHFWGNCGLRDGNWSSNACTNGDRPLPNTPSTVVIDTVENVFVQNPVPGTWTVRVNADSIGLPYLTADFALVVSLDPDCNQNGASDADDLLGNPPAALDCNYNSTPDSCDIAVGISCDGNNDDIPDECQSPLLVNGACCLSPTPGDCIFSTSCACNQQGGAFYGVGTRCTSVNCLLGPQ